MLQKFSFLLDIPPEPTPPTGMALAVILLVILLLVGVLLAGFVMLLVWRKRSQSKASINMPVQAMAGQPSSPNQ